MCFKMWRGWGLQINPSTRYIRPLCSLLSPKCYSPNFGSPNLNLEFTIPNLGSPNLNLEFTIPTKVSVVVLLVIVQIAVTRTILPYGTLSLSLSLSLYLSLSLSLQSHILHHCMTYKYMQKHRRRPWCGHIGAQIAAHRARGLACRCYEHGYVTRGKPKWLLWAQPLVTILLSSTIGLSCRMGLSIYPPHLPMTEVCEYVLQLYVAA
jgi:hypothetical protein